MTCLAVLAGPGQARASTASPPAGPALSAVLDALVADGVPGVIAIERHDGREWRYAAGVGNLQTGQPIRATDRFRVGSITKSFTSAVVLQLAGQRRLSLDDTVERWLPGLVPNGSAITVRELLNQTSGIAEYADFPFYLQILQSPLTTYRPVDLVKRAVALPAVFAPGTAWGYSNTNYILLGMIIAAADRAPGALQTYDPALQVYARIVAPLRLSRTTFPITEPDIFGAHSHGYVIGLPPELGLPPVLDTTRENPSWAWTAGAVVSTLDDVADFHKALFTGRLLAPAQQLELQTTVPAAPGLDYGLGVYQIQTACGPAWGHDGGTPSSLDIVLTSPDGKRQAGLMLNRDINTWTPQTFTDYVTAIQTAYCGPQVVAPAAASRSLTVALSRALLAGG